MMRNEFVIKNSIGDFTSPQANVEEKLAGSTRGPVKNSEGKPTMNISTLKAVR